MDTTSKARKLLTEILEPGVSPPSTFYKILLLGIRDAYDYHHDLLSGDEPVDEAERIKKYYQDGLRYWKTHDRERAIYYLGGALYHLQDAWLGLAEDPTYEAYLEKALAFEEESAPEGAPFSRMNPEKWAEEALEERKKVSVFIKQGLTLPEQKRNLLNQISLDLARRAEVAGAGLLIQFFLEALEETGDKREQERS